MNHARATALLERYFAGNSTLAEERDLQTYFRDTADVPPELASYAPLFAYWDRERQVSAPPRKVTRRLNWQRTLLAVAAALLLLLAVRGTYLWQQPNLTNFPVAERQPVDWSRYEITDRAEAARTLRAALTLTGELTDY
ncbi:hypothetical protein [Neolewinella sp.]|uniref:hypothetical protein n=1 Tax=Neolewinella sp. TaxID=2993543 RepID=UPI003B51FB0D